MHISNLRPLKRIDLLLRTFAAARSSRPMRLLILAGSSFAPYESLLDELKLRERVIVKEQVREVEEYLSAADAGLYSSEHESFGLSILETLFHAKPVVAFRIGGISEVVVDGEGGFLQPFGDMDALARSIGFLADAPALASEMGRTGRHARRKISRPIGSCRSMRRFTVECFVRLASSDSCSGVFSPCVTMRPPLPSMK